MTTPADRISLPAATARRLVPAYWEGQRSHLLLGDAERVMTSMPEQSVDCVVTSPPYYGLRDYGHPQQYGQEDTLDDYIGHLASVFGEVHRVLADTGTLWLVLGDRYAANSDGYRRGHGWSSRQPVRRPPVGLPAKNLAGIPWRLVLVLQDQGWILRNAIIWHKARSAPQPGADRLTATYDYVFLLVKQATYFFDLDVIRVPSSNTRPASRQIRRPSASYRPHTISSPWRPAGRAPLDGWRDQTNLRAGTRHHAGHPAGANPGDLWTFPPIPAISGGHPAPFPALLAERCIAAGCRPNGHVLDPFTGSSSTGSAALRLHRRFTGIDLNPDYLDASAAHLAAEEKSHL